MSAAILPAMGRNGRPAGRAQDSSTLCVTRNQGRWRPALAGTRRQMLWAAGDTDPHSRPLGSSCSESPGRASLLGTTSPCRCIAHRGAGRSSHSAQKVPGRVRHAPPWAARRGANHAPQARRGSKHAVLQYYLEAVSHWSSSIEPF